MDPTLAGESSFVDEFDAVGYVMAERVGEGQSAVVHRAYDRRTSSVVALKIFHRARDGTEDMEAEVRMYERLSHVPSDARRLFGDVLQHGLTNTYAYLSMTFFPLSLSDALDLPGVSPLDVVEVKTVFRQILEAMTYMHSQLIVHTDMKPDNIMVRSLKTTCTSTSLEHSNFEISQLDIVIVDFAASVWNVNIGHGMIGANAYRAPEVTLGLGWNSAADIFACGCILAELCMGRALFPYTKSAAQRMFVLERVIGPVPLVLVQQSERRLPSLFASRRGHLRVLIAREKIRDLVRLRKLARVATLEVHIKDQDLRDVCFDMLRLDPHLRVTASVVLSSPVFCQ